jgi:hypothetical protein
MDVWTGTIYRKEIFQYRLIMKIGYRYRHRNFIDTGTGYVKNYYTKGNDLKNIVHILYVCCVYGAGIDGFRCTGPVLYTGKEFVYFFFFDIV